MGDKDQLITELKLKIKELKQMNSNLESSLHYNNNLIDNIPNLFILLDTDGNILCANEAMASSLGTKKENLKGKNILDYFPPDVADFRTKMAHKVINTKKPISFEDERNNQWFSTKIFPILDKEGFVTQIATIVEDITDQKEKLSESKEKFDILSDQSLMGMGIIQGTEVKYANDAIVDIIGYTKKDLYTEGAKILMKIIHPEDLAFVSEQLQKKLAGDKDAIARYSCRIISKTGEIKWLEIYSKTIEYDGENADFITFVDITERKKAEIKVSDTESRLRSIFENAPDIISLIDSKGIIKFINRVPKKMKKNDLIGKKVIDYIPDNMKLEVKEIHDRILREGVSEQYEFLGGITNRWYQVHAGPIFKGDKAAGLTTITRDINDLKTIELKVTEAEEKYRSIFESMHEGIVIANINGIILEVNSAALKIFGYDAKEMIGGSTVLGYAYPEQRDLILQKLMKNGFVKNQEVTFKHKDGSLVNTLGSANLLQDKNGKVDRIVVIFADISERIKAEQEIKETKNYLQNIIDSASEIIFTINPDFKIISWSKSAERLTGIKKNKIINRNISNIGVFENSSDVLESLKSCFSGHTLSFNDIIITTKNNDRKILRPSCSAIRDENDKTKGILMICKNITEDMTLHGKLMSGSGYILLDDNLENGLNIFIDLVVSGNSGLFISRKIPKMIMDNSSLDIEYLLLNKDSNKREDYCISLDDLVSKIKDFIKRKTSPIILLDRLDYLMINYTFKDIMKTIYEINNNILDEDAMLFVHVNPFIFDGNQLAIIEEELKDIPSQRIAEINIDEDLYNILRYINDENKMNFLVSFNKISNRFSISKVTTGKRLKILENMGLLIVKRQGRSKTLYITKKGEKIIHQRDVI